jgi:putative transposase
MTVTVLDRALVASDAGRVTGEQDRPDPEVPEKARRRTFTAQYKLDVVAEYDAAATGEKGAVLRREALYSSHVIEWRRARVESVTDAAIILLAPAIGTRAAWVAAGVPQATWYRRHRLSPPPPKAAPVPHADRIQPRALAAAERTAILDTLHSDGFADLAPDEIWATLLDEGTYLGSVSTYYRVLREAGESRERRAQATHPAAVKPELIAAGPNQVYSDMVIPFDGQAAYMGRTSQGCSVQQGHKDLLQA